MKLAMIMDPIESVKTYKDTSFRLLLEAQARDYEIYYLTMNDLSLIKGEPMGNVRYVQVVDQPSYFFSLGEPTEVKLGSFDVILMPKDPPFATVFGYAAYLLQLAVRRGALVVNKPQS